MSCAVCNVHKDVSIRDKKSMLNLHVARKKKKQRSSNDKINQFLCVCLTFVVLCFYLMVLLLLLLL